MEFAGHSKVVSSFHSQNIILGFLVAKYFDVRFPELRKLLTVQDGIEERIAVLQQFNGADGVSRQNDGKVAVSVLHQAEREKRKPANQKQAYHDSDGLGRSHVSFHAGAAVKFGAVLFDGEERDSLRHKDQDEGQEEAQADHGHVVRVRCLPVSRHRDT